jgi:hypothetical protein
MYLTQPNTAGNLWKKVKVVVAVHFAGRSGDLVNVKFKNDTLFRVGDNFNHPDLFFSLLFTVYDDESPVGDNSLATQILTRHRDELFYDLCCYFKILNTIFFFKNPSYSLQYGNLC